MIASKKPHNTTITLDLAIPSLRKLVTPMASSRASNEGKIFYKLASNEELVLRTNFGWISSGRHKKWN
jgi:hypothetical protein